MPAPGIYTLATARAYLQRTFGCADSTTYNTFFDNMLNLAQKEICMRIQNTFTRKTATLTLAAGTEAYSLASDFNRDGKVIDDKWAHVEPNEYYEIKVRGDNDGNTYYTFLWDTTNKVWKIYVYPLPTAVSTETYIYTLYPTDLSGDTDKPGLPFEFENAWIYMACCLVSEHAPSGITIGECSYKRQVAEKMISDIITAQVGHARSDRKIFYKTNPYLKLK